MLIENVHGEPFDGEGRVFNEPILVSGCTNIQIVNCKFSDTYGVRGWDKPSEGIEIDSCSHVYRGDKIASLVYGASRLHNVIITRCHAVNSRLALGGNGRKWVITRCSSTNALDSVVYLRGGGHHVSKVIIVNAGKDGIKIVAPKKSCGSFDPSIIENCTVNGYGWNKPSAGGCINVEWPNVIVRNNQAIALHRHNLNSEVKGINVKADNCQVYGNTSICLVGGIPYNFKVPVEEYGNLAMVA